MRIWRQTRRGGGPCLVRLTEANWRCCDGVPCSKNCTDDAASKVLISNGAGCAKVKEAANVRHVFVILSSKLSVTVPNGSFGSLGNTDVGRACGARQLLNMNTFPSVEWRKQKSCRLNTVTFSARFGRNFVKNVASHVIVEIVCS